MLFDGEFVEITVTFQHVLKCEEKWNQWKNDGCPSYERTKSKDTLKQKTRWALSVVTILCEGKSIC